MILAANRALQTDPHRPTPEEPAAMPTEAVNAVAIQVTVAKQATVATPIALLKEHKEKKAVRISFVMSRWKNSHSATKGKAN
jgi:hypothetical protein